MTIHIDLKTMLTDEVIAKARPHLGSCTYDAPCIIGAMFPPGTVTDDIEGRSIFNLEMEGFVTFPDERQAVLACELQSAFDGGDEEVFDSTLANVREELDA
jgi:hypothetical protein